MQFDEEPVEESERLLVPVRAIFEELGAEVEWEEETQIITAKKEDTMVSHTCGIFFYYVKIFTFQTPIFCFLQARASLLRSLLLSP